MIPFAKDTLTLYNRVRNVGADGRTAESWRRRVLTGCSWVRAHERVRDEGIVRYAESVACRIPASADYLPPGDWDAQGAPPGKFTLAAGDILVRGEVDDEIGAGLSAAELVKKYARSGAAIVQSVKENTHLGPLAHYVARSSWGSAVQRGHRP